LQLDASGYEPFDGGVAGPLRDAPREVAEAYYERLMAARPARVAALAALAAAAQVELAPVPLGTWLRDVFPTTDLVDALVVDTALWLGDRIIAAAPQLQWTFYTAHKKSTGYQRAVLTGFTRVPDPRYYVDVAFMVASWADLCARRRATRPDFLAQIESVTLADA
jgi:hypothetical protein